MGKNSPYLRKETADLRGFTLIELLVVIAIIGVLSSVVLAALNTARSKGNDASIKSDLSSIMTQSEIYYDTYNGSYGTQGVTTAASGASCGGGSSMFSDSVIANATKAASSLGSSATLDAASSKRVLCSSTVNSWLVAVPLSTSASTVWCVDSTGRAVQDPISSFSGSSPATSC